jgi:hypothetical protein
MSEDQYQPYSYRPLDRSRKEIRLIFVVNQDEIQFLAETINADPEVSSDLASVRSLEDTYPVCCTIQHVSDNQVTVACATLGKFCQISLLPLRTEQHNNIIRDQYNQPSKPQFITPKKTHVQYATVMSPAAF